jgi:hypothetical protein
MDIASTKHTIIHLAPRRSVFLLSDHGKGKSQVIAQIAQFMAKLLGKPFGFIDIRLAERESGDIIGIPKSKDTFLVKMPAFAPDGSKFLYEYTAKNVMVHDIPFWFPTDPESYGFLLFDELPYAQKDVVNSVFEIALDYRMNFNPLPQGWRVIAAGNEKEIYGGTIINPALWSRFLKIWFDPTLAEWTSHAQEIGVLPEIWKYIQKFERDLDPPDSMEPGETYPDRRSWVYLSDDIKNMADDGCNPLLNLNSDNDASKSAVKYLTLLAKGRVGSSVALNWVNYVKTNFNVYNASEILNEFSDEIEQALKDIDPVDIPFYSNEIVAYIKKNEELLPRQAANLNRYVHVIPRGCVAGFWGHFVKECRLIAMKWWEDTPGMSDFIAEHIIKK